MPIINKDLDPAFQTAGANPGLEVWCIENQELVLMSESDHRKFYTGSAYIVLNAVFPKNGPPHYDIHYWLGNDTKKVDSNLASDKALELDAALGSCSVQYREIQGQESQKFLSYFKPCLIPIEGVFTSKQGNLNGEYQVSLYSCKGDYVVHVREVPFQRSSLNHEDVFILDTALKIFLFSGCNSTIQERAKGLEVVQYITENKHGGKCEVATIEDGKFVGDSDVGEFWSLFGGYAPIPREPPASQESVPPSAKQYWINLQGKICPIGSNALSKEMLESDKCYMLDCDNEIFVWMGRQTLLTERRTSIKAAEDFVRNEGRSSKTHLTFLSEGLESTVFRSHFTNWPKTVEPRLYEEGREKVAAIFKHQGYDVKELPDEKDDEPSIDYGGTIKVWRVDGDELSLLPVTEHTRLYSGDCYIVQYTFPGNGRDETLFYAWLGCRCVTEDKTAAISHVNTMVDSSRTNPVMAQIHEGKEPAQFFSILKRLIVFKGGNSSGYKKFIEEKGIVDETPNENLVALFRVQGTSPDNMQAIQVDQVSSSLNSSYCYILRSEAAMYTWIGNLSSARDHNLLDRMVELFNPAQLPVSVREGNEPDIFWDVLGGKAEYPREKEIQGFIDDPHLFALKITKGDFKMKEVYNYTQDDLITEDVLLLDCQREIYIWVGLHSVVKSKQEALNLGLKFLELDVLVESLSLEVPIYVVMEGYEPPFFTRFFLWDHSKANILGNSFERKLAILKGNSRDSTPNGHKSSSNLPSGRRRSSSPLPRSAGSDYRQSGNRLSSSPTPVSKKLFEGSPANNRAEQTTTPLSDPPSTELSSSNETASFTEKDRNINRESLSIHPYERLRVVSPNPVTGIDLTKREAYLSQEEFHEKFGMPKSSFYKLPRWKQNKLKISLDLFYNQAYNSLNHIAGLFRGFVNTITTSSAINSNSGNYGTNHFGYYLQPRPQRPSYPLNPPSPYGSKRAVLCGVCYHGRSYRLKGSINDVKCMKYFLIKEFRFPSDSILMLTDDKEERNPLKIPTKYNIQMALRWLIEGSKSGDSLVFHYSGHGTQEVNMNEIDHSYRYNNAISPVDHELKGKILNDEINATIVRPLPFGAKLHAIIDACHSGNVLDLSFVCKMNREGYYTWEDHTSSINHKDTKGGVAICISACEDGQVSVDTSALSGKEVTGALTYSFIQTVQNEPGLTYGQLLSTMRSTIHGTKTGIVTLNGPIASLLNRLLGLRIKQEAQLSSSELFDMYKKRFVL